MQIYRAEREGKGSKDIKSTFFSREYLLDYSLASMNLTQIALWNGILMGGGVGVSVKKILSAFRVHSPIRVATNNTMFAMPETGIGFFTDVGGSHFRSRVRENISLGLYQGITGLCLNAQDCVK